MIRIVLLFVAVGVASFFGVRWYLGKNAAKPDAPHAVQSTPTTEAPAAAPAPEDRSVTGVVRHISEKCGFGLELENGTQLVPANLAADFVIPGVQLRFTYRDAGFADDCDGFDAVHLEDVAEIGIVKLPSACAEARIAYATLISVVQALEETCERDADCVSFGDDPTALCYRPKFTSEATFAPFKRRHDRLNQLIDAECDQQTATCDNGPRQPHCQNKTCEGL